MSLHKWIQSLMGAFTFHGGGKGGGAPDAPDYEKLAKQQSKMQSDLLRQQTEANRIDQYTPFGSLTYSRGGDFDQAGYDKAMAQYNKNLEKYSAQPSSGYSGGGSGIPGIFNPMLHNGLQSWGQQGNGVAAPQAPTREMFGFGPDKWSSNMTLAPELQQILENEWATKQQGYGELQNYLQNINDPSKVNASPINPGQTAQDAIMARLQPSFNTEDEAVRNRLYSQGVRPGTEAWDNEMRNFERSRNDAYSQAALQGIDLDFRARQNSLAEQGLPLNAIQSFLSGGQVQAPQFQQGGQQGVAQSPDLLGAGQAQYNSALNSYNASQASQGNMLSGLFGLGGTVLGGMFGGPAGAMAGGALGGAMGGGGGAMYSY